MTADTTPDITPPGITLGHLALHYCTPEEGPLAARLLQTLGFKETQKLVLPSGSNFYRYVVADEYFSRGDGIIFLSIIPDAVRKVVEAARTLLKVGKAGEDPAVTSLDAAMANDPEYAFHIGFLVSSLEELEAIFTRLEDLNANDPALKGRLTLLYNRPPRGTPQVDARLDRSPHFGKTERQTYGHNGVQAFLYTDLLFSGPLGEGLTLEFDYVFPGSDTHILSVAEI